MFEENRQKHLTFIGRVRSGRGGRRLLCVKRRGAES
jgi:hypothetical protein